MSISNLKKIIPYCTVRKPTSLGGELTTSSYCYSITHYDYKNPFTITKNRPYASDIIHEDITSSWRCFIESIGNPKYGLIIENAYEKI